MTRTREERDAEFAAQQARAAERCPGADQYQALIGTLSRTDPPAEGMNLITMWGAVNVATGQPLAEPDGRTGAAVVRLPVAGQPGEVYTYTMPGSHDGEPTPRLTGNLDDLIAWVRELPGGGVLHIGRQWYDLTPKTPAGEPA